VKRVMAGQALPEDAVTYGAYRETAAAGDAADDAGSVRLPVWALGVIGGGVALLLCCVLCVAAVVVLSQRRSAVAGGGGGTAAAGYAGSTLAGSGSLAASRGSRDSYTRRAHNSRRGTSSANVLTRGRQRGDWQ